MVALHWGSQVVDIWSTIGVWSRIGENWNQLGFGISFVPFVMNGNQCVPSVANG